MLALSGNSESVNDSDFYLAGWFLISFAIISKKIVWCKP
jgi:hypothetical protein